MNQVKFPSSVCQKKALEFEVKSRGKLLISARSVAVAGESYAGGGSGRNSLGEASTHGLQKEAFTQSGLVPIQRPGPVGTVPVQGVSVPSVRAYSITFPATERPNSYPARTSLGK